MNLPHAVGSSGSTRCEIAEQDHARMQKRWKADRPSNRRSSQPGTSNCFVPATKLTPSSKLKRQRTICHLPHITFSLLRTTSSLHLVTFVTRWRSHHPIYIVPRSSARSVSHHILLLCLLQQFGSLPSVSAMYSTAAYPSADFPTSAPTYPQPTPSAYPDSSLSYYSTSYSQQPPSTQVTPSAMSSAASPSAANLFGSMDSTAAPSSSSSFEEDLPLLEELGINPKDIWQRTLSVSLPFFPLPTNDDSSDLAGPFCFCLLLGGLLLLHGKVHFGYIYGFGATSCLLLYLLLNLMSDSPISVERVISTLGYSLVPLVMLAGVGVFVDCRGVVGGIGTAIMIVWCVVNAVRLFEAALHMREQRWLIAYPIILIYGIIALLTVF